MTGSYTCSTCGVVAATAAQLCNPRDETFDEYCGSAPQRAALCTEMREHVTYVCGKCGRPAQSDELLCQPLVVG